MNLSTSLYKQALEKVTETIEARRAGYAEDFLEAAESGDGWFSQHEQGILDAYDEVQMLLDSVNYELDEMLTADRPEQRDMFAGAVMQQ